MTRPALAVLLLGALIAGALTWPLPMHLGEWMVHDTFSGSHAWTADHVFLSLTGERGLSPTSAAGYPYVRFAPFIGWLNNLFTIPLRPIFGPLGAFQVVHLLSLALTAVATLPLLRRWTDADPWTCAAAALSFAFCPYLLSTLAIGETPKLQAWAFPLFLWAAQRWMDGRVSGAVWGVLVAAALGFTSPYYGMALPLIIGVFCVICFVRAEGWRGRAWALAPLGWTALALLPVYAYFGGPQHAQQASLMRPAMAGETGMVLPQPHPVATPMDLLFGSAPLTRTPFEVYHLTYLGLPLLIAAVVLILVSRGRAKGAFAGVVLLLGGVLLAMGPNLAVGERFTTVPLPAMLLAWAGYPYVRGGMWFRLVVIAALGLSVLLAAGAARWRHGRWLAWGVLALQLADGVRATGPWPLVVQPVPGYAQLVEMRRSGSLDDGAVLHLPLQEGLGLVEGQRMLAAAAVHGRPTTAMARVLLPVESSAMRAMIARALAAPDPAQALRDLGFRYVVHQPMAELRSRISREELSAKLGPGEGGLQLMRWDLGPTRLAPQRRLPGQVGPGWEGPPRR